MIDIYRIINNYKADLTNRHKHTDISICMYDIEVFLIWIYYN